MVAWFMGGVDGCIFLKKIPNDKYECTIKTGEEDITELTPRIRKYFFEQCLPYPCPTEEAHTPPIHELPDKCGYRMVWVNGE
jgi:hypothetical protein